MKLNTLKSLVVLGGILFTPSLYATTVYVNTAADVVSATDGLCSLREAVSSIHLAARSGSPSGECAAGNGTSDIVAIPGGTYSLLSAIDIKKNMSIVRDARSSAAVYIQPANRVIGPLFTIFKRGTIVSMWDLNIRFATNTGISGQDAAIINLGDLTLSEVDLGSNIGAVDNDGDLTIEDSNIASNGNALTNEVPAILNRASGTLNLSNTWIHDSAAGAIDTKGNINIVGGLIEQNGVQLPSGSQDVGVNIKPLNLVYDIKNAMIAFDRDMIPVPVTEADVYTLFPSNSCTGGEDSVSKTDLQTILDHLGAAYGFEITVEDALTLIK